MRMQKFFWSVGIASMMFDITASENLLKGGDGEDPGMAKQWGQGTVQNISDKKSGTACMECAFVNRNFIFSPEFIEIDPSKSYRLSGFFKTGAKDQKCKSMIGMSFYNTDKRLLTPTSVRVVPNTETTLSADAKKDDKVISVASKEWIKHKGNGVAFDAKDDYSDLPNFETIGILEASEKGAVSELTLRSPLTKDYPAGTKVRAHRYQDYALSGQTTTSEWTENTFTLSGESKLGFPEKGKFWNGTKYVKISIFAILDKGAAPLLFDDITFQEVTKE